MRQEAGQARVHKHESRSTGISTIFLHKLAHDLLKMHSQLLTGCTGILAQRRKNSASAESEERLKSKAIGRKEVLIGRS